MPDDVDQAARDRAAAAEARRQRILQRGQARFSQITATYNAPTRHDPPAVQPAAQEAVPLQTPVAVQPGAEGAVQPDAEQAVQLGAEGAVQLGADQAVQLGAEGAVQPAAQAAVQLPMLQPAPQGAARFEVLQENEPSTADDVTESFLDPAPSISALPEHFTAPEMFLDPAPSISNALEDAALLGVPHTPPYTRVQPDTARHSLHTPTSTPAAHTSNNTSYTEGAIPASRGTRSARHAEGAIPASRGTSSSMGVEGAIPIPSSQGISSARRAEGVIPASRGMSTPSLTTTAGVLGQPSGKGAFDEGASVAGGPASEGTGSKVVATCVAAVHSVMGATDVLRLLLTVVVAVSLAMPRWSILWPAWPPILTVWATQMSVVLPLVLVQVIMPSMQVFKAAGTSPQKSVALGILGLIPGMKPVAAVMGCLGIVFMALVDSTTIFLVVFILTQSMTPALAY